MLAITSQALAPLVRIPARMEAGRDLDGVIYLDEEHAIGETPEQRPAHVAADHWESVRCSGNIRQTGVDRADELRPETWGLSLLPHGSVGDVGFRVRTDDQR